jgi:hypothetical protein
MKKTTENNMSTVIVDAKLRTQILAAQGEIEFRDEAGNLLAHGRRLANLQDQMVEGNWPTEEQLDSIAKMTGGVSTSQLLDHLRGVVK